MGQKVSTSWGEGSLDETGAEERYIRQLVDEKHWTKIVDLIQKAPEEYARERNAKTGLLPLHWALMKQAPYEVISCLVALHPDAIRENDTSESKRKPVHLAAIYYSKDSRPLVLEFLIDKDPGMVSVGDEDWRLPLHLAAQSKASKESLSLLLETHPDGATRRTKGTKLPIHIACEFRAPFESVKVLLDAYPLGAKESSGLRYPLHFACEFKGSYDVIQALLHSYPEAAVAKAGPDTLLPIHLAAANKAGPEIISLLLQHYPEAVVDRDNNMRLPLHHAIERNACDETVILLIKTCPETASVMGYLPHLPLHIALEKDYSVAVVDALLEALPGSSQTKDAYGILPLRRAIKSRSSPEVVLSLLRDDKLKAATKELDEYERLTLHYACARKMPLTVIQALVEACPEAVKVPDKNGQLPLHLSVMRNAEIDIIKLLIEKFPEAIMTRDNYSYLPLHHAVEVGTSDEIYDTLLSTDRRCSEIRADGRLPLHFAIETKRSPKVISTLLKAFPSAAIELEHEKGRIALQHAIERRHSAQVLEELMAEYPFECSMVKDNDGRQAAHYCIEHEAPVQVLKKILQGNPAVVSVKDLSFFFYQPSESGDDKSVVSYTTNLCSRGVTTISRPTSRRPGKQIIHYAAEDMGTSSQLVEELLMTNDGGLIMPISASSGAVNLHHGHAWTFILSECNDRYADAVERILDRYSTNIKSVQLLCEAPDELGRPATQIATPVCRKFLMGRLHFFGRYEFVQGPITHESENSMVKLAIDHGGHDGKRTVALKFMKHRDQFDREVNLRSRVKFSDDFVVPILSSHDSKADPDYSKEVKRKGFVDYPYCVATAAAERDLQTIILREHISNYDYSRIRLVALHLLQALDHFHELNLIHGDVKPMNVVRVGGRFKFIDLGASVFFGSLAGTVKVSSAYMPPEMVFVPTPKFQNDHDSAAYDEQNPDGLAPPSTAFDQSAPSKYFLSSKTGLPVPPRQVRGQSVNIDIDPPRQVECIPAHPSIDMWSFGALFFFLCTGETLLPCTVEDNLDALQLTILAKWEDGFKFERLAKVSDPMARNLILQLLSLNPNRRPNSRAALNHPFFSVPEQQISGTSFRFQGMKPKYDVCIIFRKVTDRMRARNRIMNPEAAAAAIGEENNDPENNEDEKYSKALAKRLVDAGLSVCYSDIDGTSLIMSKACCVILSRTAINNEIDFTRNFGKIDNESTDIDAMFLDTRLAIELTHHGLLEGGVHAILVGDKVAMTTKHSEGGEEDNEAAVEEEKSTPPPLSANQSADKDVKMEYAPYYATHDGEILGRWGGSHPLQMCTEPIELVERKMGGLLQDFFLGACPILNKERASVTGIMHDLVSSNNILVLGDVDTAWEIAAEQVIDAIALPDGQQAMQEDYEHTEDKGQGSAQDGIRTANLALLQEKVLTKEHEIAMLIATIDREREQLDASKLQLQSLKYKYSIFE